MLVLPGDVVSVIMTHDGGRSDEIANNTFSFVHSKLWLLVLFVDCRKTILD